ncbi:lamina-associated polypeptide 2-like [Xenopus tropicalis]|uniref:Lamina-associated polypeptide 2-like n=1 Tax=Xenopus tropicalis TaxID=8364 RepID=A0A8J0SWZ9_XENTR|nr:lamina-associated polypeptide 2-like [Xenopus tropicalis]|eukprot:XP_012824552.1 PREDICTED: lamina-associated polypeptide 2-like [Xenopus tropicalis]
MEVLKVEETTSTTKKSKGLFRRSADHSIVFPVHEQLQAIIQEEWNTPEHKFQVTKKFAKLYPIPKEEMEKWGSPPAVDAPVSRLSKSTALPVADASAFKDATDKKLEGFLKAIYTAAGAALRPTIAMAWVGRALEAWSDLILTGIREEIPVEDIETLVLRIQEASSYLSEASLDVLKTVARSSALSVAARRALWLRLWSADLSSKRSLTSLPFKGSRLFGKELEKIIFRLPGVKVPQTKAKHNPSTGKRRFFRGQGFRNSKSSSPTRQFSHKGRYNPKGKPTWQPRKSSNKTPHDKQSST